MTQFKMILKRLRQPSVILSVVSQVISLLILFGVGINEDLAMSVAMGVCSILVTLGILSNPDSRKKGYGDDLLICENCGKPTHHVQIAGRMVCSQCGKAFDAPDETDLKPN